MTESEKLNKLKINLVKALAHSDNDDFDVYSNFVYNLMRAKSEFDIMSDIVNSRVDVELFIPYLNLNNETINKLKSHRIEADRRMDQLNKILSL